MNFVTKGYEGKIIHGSHAMGSLEIKGTFHISGPQPVNNEGGAPEWVADLLEKYPEINQVALSGEKWSVVWGRMEEIK